MRIRVSWVMVSVVVVALGSAAAGQNPIPGHPDSYPRVEVEHGARVYAEQCERCHGADGGGVSSVNLRSGKFRNASTDQQLQKVILSGFPTSGMPAFPLGVGDLTGVIAYLRNMNTIDRGSLKPGNMAAGREIVETKGGCLSCHRINGKGSRKAPDLSSIGAVRSAGSIERSLREPTSQMWPINRPVRVVMKSGKVVTGRRLNEDTYTVQLADQDGELISLNKADVRELTVATVSTMPSYNDELTAEELSHVIAYLVSLKGL